MEEGNRRNNRHGNRQHHPEENRPVVGAVNPRRFLKSLRNFPEEGHEDDQIEEAEHYRNNIDQEIIEQVKIPVQQKRRNQSPVEEQRNRTEQNVELAADQAFAG
ncbi:hypothetical protein D3C75_829260 [compost metagenome]